MKKILSKQCRYVTYDPDQDQSERFGWPKYCDEHTPSEQEQKRWGLIMVLSTLILASITLITYL